MTVSGMRDVSAKVKTLRMARARAQLKILPATATLIREGQAPKGDPFEVARVAAIQAAKNTGQIIPYCHPLPIDFVGVEFDLGEDGIVVEATVKAIHKTGVEMEALAAASVAALTLYDMLKMVDDSMEIASVRLVEKRGGKSDFAGDAFRSVRAAVLVISDSVAAGRKRDAAGQAIRERLESEGIEVAAFETAPDEPETVAAAVARFSDEMKLNLVLTTGGTGFSPRDRTPEAMDRVIEREAPGISEAMRAYGQERTPYSMLSRGRAGVRGETLIVNLPGSRGGVAECLDFLFPHILHAFKMLRGGSHGGRGYGGGEA